MRWGDLAAVIALLGLSAPIGAQEKEGAKPMASNEVTVNFDEGSPGKAAEGFSMALTGGGGPGEWVVKDDPSAPSGGQVLAQLSEDGTDDRFPLCVYDGFAAKDVSASVRFKPVAGEVDQAAGLVVRYKDKDNYYIARANALENNVRLYRVVEGKRKQFASANATVKSGEWHALQFEVKGRHLKVSFDGKLLFEADDETFKDVGKVGLWTKADSVTYFDDLVIRSLDGL
jgi:hypothetical protein